MNDEQLKQMLREWKPGVQVPGDFRARVWERIAMRQESREQTLGAQFQRWWISFFLRPAPAATLGAIMLMLSIGIGWWKGNADRAETWRRLEAQYVESVDPYAQVAMR